MDYKFITLTLNPALDKTLYLKNPLSSGGLNRVANTKIDAGGKGVNAAKMLKTLGALPLCVMLAGGVTGDELTKLLKAEEIETRIITTEAPTRTNIKIIDSTTAGTELNELGGPVTADELRKLFTELELIITENTTASKQYILMGGSYPQAVDNGVYKLLIEHMKKRGVICALDCDGEAFHIGIDAGPDYVKPNAAELAQYYSTEISTTAEAVNYASRMHGEKGTNVLCTLGEKGSIFVSDAGIYTASAPAVVQRGFAGAGDSFLAAFMFEHSVSGDITSSLTLAAAAAAAKVATMGTEMPKIEAIQKLTKQVTVKKLPRVF